MFCMKCWYNLDVNAIKYNKEGGYVKVLLAREKDGVRWSVEDNGIGIAKEEQERIFERFYRVDKSHSRKTGGTRAWAFYCEARGSAASC